MSFSAAIVDSLLVAHFALFLMSQPLEVLVPRLDPATGTPVVPPASFTVFVQSKFVPAIKGPVGQSIVFRLY